MFRIVSASASRFNQERCSNRERILYKNMRCYSKENQRRRVKTIVCQPLSQSQTPKRVKAILCHSPPKRSRGVCPPLPQVAPPSKAPSTGLGLTILGLMLIACGVIAYAKYDCEFRETLTEYVPVSDDVIKVVFQEEQPFMDSIHDIIDSFKEE